MYAKLCSIYLTGTSGFMGLGVYEVEGPGLIGLSV